MEAELRALFSRFGEKANKPLWRLNHLYRVIDIETGGNIPFVMNIEQERLFKMMHTFNVILKSRQHGFTTFICLIMLDACLFNSNIRAGVVAHEQKKAQEIFADKIKWVYQQLPEFITDLIKAEKLDGGELRLSNNSAIRVSTSMRSGTLHYLLISEHGKLCAKYPKRALELKTGTLPTVHEGGVIWDESTAEGPAGDFHDMSILSQGATAEADKAGRQLGPLEWRFHFFPWFKHPQNQTNHEGVKISDELKRYFADLEKKGINTSREQQAWYALTKDGPTGLGRYMKREHPSTPEEAFEQSVEGAIWAEEMQLCYAEGRVGFYPHIQNMPVCTFWDLGYRNATSIIFVQFVGEQIRFIDHHNERGRGAAYHAGIVKDKPYTYDRHFFPHDIMNHEKGSGIILGDVYSSLGIKYNKIARPQLKEDGLESVRNIFPQFVFHAPKTNDLRKSLAYYRYAWDDEFCRFSKDPVEDGCTDDADAVQTLGMKYRMDTVGGHRAGWQTVSDRTTTRAEDDKCSEYDVLGF